MCGVIGMFAPQPKAVHLDGVVKLFVQSQIRGLHAFGFSYYKNGVIKTEKFISLEPLFDALADLKKDPPSLLIGHTRYSTSGDWKNPDNNQPIALPKEDFSLVFNGVITQETKEEYSARLKKTFVTENDGEIFARKVLDGEKWERWIEDNDFSFAGLFLHKGRMLAIRNENRPLWLGNFEGAVFVGSTQDIFLRSIIFSKIRRVPSYKAVVFDKTVF